MRWSAYQMLLIAEEKSRSCPLAALQQPFLLTCHTGFHNIHRSNHMLHPQHTLRSCQTTSSPHPVCCKRSCAQLGPSHWSYRYPVGWRLQHGTRHWPKLLSRFWDCQSLQPRDEGRTNCCLRFWGWGSSNTVTIVAKHQAKLIQICCTSWSTCNIQTCDWKQGWYIDLSSKNVARYHFEGPVVALALVSRGYAVGACLGWGVKAIELNWELVESEQLVYASCDQISSFQVMPNEDLLVPQSLILIYYMM